MFQYCLFLRKTNVNQKLIVKNKNKSCTIKSTKCYFRMILGKTYFYNQSLFTVNIFVGDLFDWKLFKFWQVQNFFGVHHKKGLPVPLWCPVNFRSFHKYNINLCVYRYGINICIYNKKIEIYFPRACFFRHRRLKYPLFLYH